jgi:hypothetical protein
MLDLPELFVFSVFVTSLSQVSLEFSLQREVGKSKGRGDTSLSQVSLEFSLQREVGNAIPFKGRLVIPKPLGKGQAEGQGCIRLAFFIPGRSLHPKGFALCYSNYVCRFQTD